MALTTLNITENYDDLDVLTETHLNTTIQSIEDWAAINNLDITQLALDIFGAYTFNGDGVQTEVPSLMEQVSLIAADNIFEGANTFQGATTFEDAVTSTSTFSSSGQMRTRAYHSTINQSISNSAFNAITLDAENYDIGSLHSNAVNPSQFIIPAGGSGVYQFHGQVTFAANATGRREAAIYKNGSEIARSVSPTASAGFTSVVQVSCHDVAGPSDYYELFAYQSSGGALDAVFGDKVTFFSCMKVW